MVVSTQTLALPQVVYLYMVIKLVFTVPIVFINKIQECSYYIVLILFLLLPLLSLLAGS